jgi:hypothetical protein
MANDQYISRFLTAAWENEPGRQHQYDFETGTFDDRPSEPLTADEVLGVLVETPAGAYRAEILRGEASGNPSGDWRIYRALVATIWLQVSQDPTSRIEVPDETPFTVDGLCAQRETLLDLMGNLSRDRYPLIGVSVPPAAAPLFFTEAAYFSIPMVGAPPILAVPITPRHFIATPGVGFPGEVLHQWLLHPTALSAFSLGTSPIDRVVIPPELLAMKQASSLGFQRFLCEQRKNAEGLLEVAAEANRMVYSGALGRR